MNGIHPSNPPLGNFSFPMLAIKIASCGKFNLLHTTLLPIDKSNYHILYQTLAWLEQMKNFDEETFNCKMVKLSKLISK